MTCECVEAETYRQMHETARELGYPSILEALEALDHITEEKREEPSEAMIEAGAEQVSSLWGSHTSNRERARRVYTAMRAATSSDRSE